MSAIPECGPARDRMVAEVVGWPHWDRTFPWNPGTAQYFAPSTSPADALAALDAWVAGDEPNRRWYTVNRWSDGRVEVTLYPVRLGGALYFKGEEPTLPAAATAALLATKEVPA